MIRHRRLTTLLAAAAFAVSLGAAAPAHAAVIQLGFILDSSGSIGSSNWTIITSGLATAIQNNIPTSGPDQYEVTVVSFSTTAATIVSPTVITSGNVATVAGLVTAAPFQAQNTSYAAAFSLMQADLTGSSNFSAGGLSYVNFATDGVPNVGGNGVTERNALTSAGIDNISIEGIGAGLDASFLQTSICYPLACETVFPPTNFPAQGFYVGVANAQGYADAIGTKIAVVTGQSSVPEPTTLLLVGSGLALARRMKKMKKGKS